MSRPAGGRRRVPPHQDLLDWRRRVADLYADVRRSGDPEAAWRRWRRGRHALFKSHPQSPLDDSDRARFRGLRYFDYDPALRFRVTLAPLGETAPRALDVGADGRVALAPFAVTAGLGERLGGELTVYWIGGYGGGLFLPFRDGTSGGDTYGGGRYLYDSIKGADLGEGADGTLVIDLNFAYNPSCAYSERWSCPLAPPENGLAKPVLAGEKAWR